jgi:tetratricopeptide (TPR) repeat protein
MRRELADAYTETGDVYARRGVMPEADAAWPRAASLDAQNVTCRWRLASLYERSGRDAQAQHKLEEIAALQPGGVQCRLALGVVLARSGQLDAAEGVFRDVIRLAPQLSIGYQHLARLLMVARRDAVEARSAAEQAVRLEPSAENYALLGASCQMNGDVPGAIEALEHAMRLDPENAEYPRIHASLRRDK